jgi:hypothetical protein
VPSVPRYSQPQVREDAAPGFRSNLELPDEVAGMGRASQKLLDTVADVATKIKQDADQLAVLDADKELSAMETRILYDQQKGALNKKGKDAFGIAEQVDEEFNKGVSEIESRLGNNTQRAAFRRMSQSRMSDVNRTLQKHVSGEIEKFDDEVTNAYLANERDAAAANYLDNDRVNISVERQRAALQDHANRKGLPEEWVKLKMQESSSKTYGSVIGRMLANGDDKMAKEYYEKNKTAFTGADQTAIEKDLEEGSLRGESQRMSDQIFAKNSGSMTRAFEEARKIDDPKLRDETTSRIKDRFAMKEAAERDNTENLYRGATDIIDQTGDVDKIPVGQWKQFSLSERSALKNYAAHKRAGTQPETEWGDYYELKTLASSPSTKDKFLKMNMMAYRPKMADPEFKELVSLQTQLRNGDDKADKLLDGYRTDSAIVNDALLAAGIDISGKANDKEKEKTTQFRRMVDEQIIKYQQDTGKKATNEQVQSIVDNLMVKGITERGLFRFFDTEKRLFETATEEDFQIGVEDVPKGERKKIEEALTRRGIPVTDDNILNTYGVKLKNMTGRK